MVTKMSTNASPNNVRKDLDLCSPSSALNRCLESSLDLRVYAEGMDIDSPDGLILLCLANEAKMPEAGPGVRGSDSHDECLQRG